MIIYIYALLDPDTDEVRYVGKTDNTNRRLSRHIHVAENDNPAKVKWVTSLKANGKIPKMVILEESAPDTWVDREKHWIAYYRASGAALTNLSSGGHGRDTKYPHQIIARVSAETKAELNRIMSRTGMSEADIGRAAVDKLISLFQTEENEEHLSPDS